MPETPSNKMGRLRHPGTLGFPDRDEPLAHWQGRETPSPKGDDTALPQLPGHPTFVAQTVRVTGWGGEYDGMKGRG